MAFAVLALKNFVKWPSPAHDTVPLKQGSVRLYQLKIMAAMILAHGEMNLKPTFGTSNVG